MSDNPREARSQDSDDARNDAVGDNPTDTSSADQTSGGTDRDVADRPADTAESTDRPADTDGPATTDGTDHADRADADETTKRAGQGADHTASQDDATQVMAPVDDQDRESRRVTREELYARDDRRGEQERLAAVRADHEAATAPAEPVPAPVAEEPTGRRKRMKYPRTTDRFFPSLGLLLLRLTMALVFGVHGVQKLLTMEQTSQFFESLSLFGMPLPYPSVLALATGVAEVMIAVSLAFGFLVRFASVGVLLITIGALLMVRMTTLPNPLEPGASGISGELELVLAGAGALLLCVGGGAWALDRLFRRGRYSKDPRDLAA